MWRIGGSIMKLGAYLYLINYSGNNVWMIFPGLSVSWGNGESFRFIDIEVKLLCLGMGLRFNYQK